MGIILHPTILTYDFHIFALIFVRIMMLYYVDLSPENWNIEEVERVQARVFVPFWSEKWYTLCLFWSGIGYGF